MRWSYRVRRPASGVAGHPQAGEGPAGRGREEVTIAGADVFRRGHAGPAAEHILVDHELAVVLAHRAGGDLEPRVGAVGGGGPLPDVPEGAGIGSGAGDRARMQDAPVEEVALGGPTGGRDLPLGLG